MGVSCCCRRRYHLAILINFASSSVYDGATVGPWAERIVAVGISQSIVCHRKTEFAVISPAAVYKDILVLDLADGRGFEETESIIFLSSRNHVLYDLSARLHRTHGLRIKLRRIRALKAPISIYSSVVIDKDSRIKSQHALRHIWIVLAPVAYLERAVRPRAAGYQVLASAHLVIRVQVVHPASVRLCLHSYVRREKDI